MDRWSRKHSRAMSGSRTEGLQEPQLRAILPTPCICRKFSDNYYSSFKAPRLGGALLFSGESIYLIGAIEQSPRRFVPQSREPLPAKDWAFNFLNSEYTAHNVTRAGPIKITENWRCLA